MEIKNKSNKGMLALSQILILVVGMVAISYAIGSSVGVVSGSDEDCIPGETKCINDETYKKCSDQEKWEEFPCPSTRRCVDTQDGAKCIEIISAEEDEESPLEDRMFNYGGGDQPSNLYNPTTGKPIKKNSLNLQQAMYYWNLFGRPGEKKTREMILGFVEEKDKAKFLEEVVKNTKEGVVPKDVPVPKEKWFAKLSPWMRLTGQIIFNAGVAIGIYFTVREIALNQGQTIRQSNSLGATFGSGYYSYKVTKIFIQNAIKKKLAKKIAVKTLTKIGEEVTKEALKEAGKQVTKEAIKTAGLQSIWTGAPTWLTAGLASFGIGLAVSLIIFSLTYKKRAFEVVALQCNVWDAESGGDNCELCNKQGILPCSEYQCKSLGRSCEIVNKGTDKEMCTFSDRGDTEYPIITPWEDALLKDYKYNPDNAISPPDKGTYVKYQKSKTGDGCIPAFTALSFGITLNEPAKCKASNSREGSFEDMGNNYLSSGMSDYNHSYTTPFSSSEAMEMEQLIFENDGNYEVYIRCEDAAGNSNPANFVFKFCADASPDLTPPSIIMTDPLKNSPILFNITSTDIRVYVDKPADCKWSRANKSYGDMEYAMTCARNMSEMNAQMLFKCFTTLDGLENRKENKFYFKCKSYPDKEESERVSMQQSYIYNLIGTEPLILNLVTPNNTLIKSSTEPIKINLEATTSAGHDDGRSMCMYSTDGEMYVTFFGDENFNNYQHSQDLWLVEGNYEYYIKCFDLGGNTDTTTINFSVEIDTSAPEVIRVYREGASLKLITDEEAECRYGTSSNVGCDYNFEEGNLMVSMGNDLEHYVDWDSNVNFYIKCGEIREGGLYPPQNECSLIVRPFDIYS